MRAAAVLLIAHYDRRHLDTIGKLVEVWAPPNENDTEAYAVRRRERLRHRRATRPARLRLLEADPHGDDQGRERPPALHRRADRRGTGARSARRMKRLSASCRTSMRPNGDPSPSRCTLSANAGSFDSLNDRTGAAEVDGRAKCAGPNSPR